MRETLLQSNAVSHWLGANLEAALKLTNQWLIIVLIMYTHTVQLNSVVNVLTHPLQIWLYGLLPMSFTVGCVPLERSRWWIAKKTGILHYFKDFIGMNHSHRVACYSTSFSLPIPAVWYKDFDITAQVKISISTYVPHTKTEAGMIKKNPRHIFLSEVWRLFAPDLRRLINSFSGSDFKPRLVYKFWFFCYFFINFGQQF